MDADQGTDLTGELCQELAMSYHNHNREQYLVLGPLRPSSWIPSTNREPYHEICDNSRCLPK